MTGRIFNYYNVERSLTGDLRAIKRDFWRIGGYFGRNFVNRLPQAVISGTTRPTTAGTACAAG
jgi:hypothetical protein